MRFIIDGDERYSTIEIHVLIVEDSFEQGRNIKSSIESYQSLFNGKRDIFRNDIKINYKVFINGKFDYPEHEFKSEMAFADSLQYLKENGV